MTEGKYVGTKSVVFDWQKMGVHLPLGIQSIQMDIHDENFFAQQAIMRMTAMVLTEKLPPVEYVHQYPGVQTWVDRLKLRLMSRWGFRWLERFPARPSLLRTKVILEPFYVYPDASLPYEVGGEQAIRMHHLLTSLTDFRAPE